MATFTDSAGTHACEVVRVILPGGFIDRLFGGRLPVYVIRVNGETFATHSGAIAL